MHPTVKPHSCCSNLHVSNVPDLVDPPAPNVTVTKDGLHTDKARAVSTNLALASGVLGGKEPK